MVYRVAAVETPPHRSEASEGCATKGSPDSSDASRGATRTGFRQCAVCPMDGRVWRTLRLMAHRLQNPFRPDELARRGGISRDHLLRLFRRDAGRSLTQALRVMRLREAARLLSDTNMGLKDLAALAGYVGTDLSHFRREFKAAEGFTPAEYRQSARRAGLTSVPEGVSVASALDERQCRYSPYKCRYSPSFAPCYFLSDERLSLLEAGDAMMTGEKHSGTCGRARELPGGYPGEGKGRGITRACVGQRSKRTP